MSELALRAVEPESRLDELIGVIESEHEQVTTAGREMIQHAIAAGEALLEARGIVPHGQWLTWMGENLSVCVWTAHRYMRLAGHKDEVLATDVRFIEDAMRLLADKPRLGHGPRAFSEKDRAEIFGHYHEHGMASTMKAWNIAKSTVWRIVSDKSPARYDPDSPRLPSEVNADTIERLSQWLVERFGGDAYPVRVTNEVRADAEAALIAAHTAPDESGLSRDEKLKRAQEMYEAGAGYAQIAARLGVSAMTAGRWVNPELAESGRRGSLAWKEANRTRNRERDRLHAQEQNTKPNAKTQTGAQPIKSVSPFDRLMWDQEGA